MAGLKVFFAVICIVGCFHAVVSDEHSSYSFEEIPQLAEPEPTESYTPIAKQPNLVTIDLSECTCTSEASCNLAILKSSLMEITCGAEESLCCPMKKSETPSVDDKVEGEEQAEVEQPRSNVRVYTITPSVYQEVNTSAIDKYLSRKYGKSKKCGCKARSKCPQKYIDYGFGFYCTYNTVRCCMPEEEASEEVTLVDSEKVETVPLVEDMPATEIADVTLESAADASDSKDVESVENEEEMGSITAEESEAAILTTAEEVDVPVVGNQEESGVVAEEQVEEQVEGQREEEPVEEKSELVITEVTNWSGLDGEEGNFDKDAECYCLPIQKCQQTANYDINAIERRRDTLCPGDLVQCCGKNLMDEITKKRDEVGAEYDPVPEVKSEVSEPPVLEAINPIPETPTVLATNDNGFAGVPSTGPIVERVPISSVLPEPYPGYQPPGYYKGYGQQQQQPHRYQSQPYSSGQQPVTNNQYYGNGQQQQQQHQNAYDTTGAQNYSPWLYSKYPAGQGQPQNGYYPMRTTYGGEQETPRHRPGGLFESLTKLLG